MHKHSIDTKDMVSDGQGGIEGHFEAHAQHGDQGHGQQGGGSHLLLDQDFGGHLLHA